MGGRLRVDILEGQAQIIFEYDIRGDLLADDFGKDRVTHDVTLADKPDFRHEPLYSVMAQ